MINFAEVEESVKSLKQQVIRGDIDGKVFEGHLLEMIGVARDGYYWMFGHESERWFRHDGEKWIPDDPSKILDSEPEGVTLPRANQSSPHTATEQNLESEWRSINWGWFITSLVILVFIGVVVYYATLT